MARQSILLLTTLLFCASQLGAQVTSTAQNFTVQVSAAQSRTDTGLDLQSGDIVEISAVVAPVSDQPAEHAVPVAPACDPKGLTGAVAQTSDLPLSTAAPSPAVAPPTLSNAPLDRQLRKRLDRLPRRVNDQFQNLGDMVNFVVIGSQKDVQTAFDAATWHAADTNNKKAVVNAIMETYDSKDYLAMPMSTLYLFGRKQDFGYEMAEPIAVVASRHHFRIWKAPFTWKGQEVWVGAGTHDIGFARDKRNGNVTHKIDPAVDGERDNIGSSLQKANKTTMLSYYLPSNPVQDARNATGDDYHSDGRLLVIFLQ
jgi:hypothetical protein